jgi:hypothetical protein
VVSFLDKHTGKEGENEVIEWYIRVNTWKTEIGLVNPF